MQRPGSLYLPRPDGAGRSISPYDTPPVARLTLFFGAGKTGKTTELDQLGRFAADPVPRPVLRVDPWPGERLEGAVARVTGRYAPVGQTAYELGPRAVRGSDPAVLAIDNLQRLDPRSVTGLVAVVQDDRLAGVRFVGATSDERMQRRLHSQLGSQLDLRVLRPFTPEELEPLLEHELSGHPIAPGADYALLRAANGSAGELKALAARVLQHPLTRKTNWVTVEAAGEAIRPEPAEFKRILDASPRAGTGKKPDPGAETTQPVRRPGPASPGKGQGRGG